MIDLDPCFLNPLLIWEVIGKQVEHIPLPSFPTEGTLVKIDLKGGI